MMPHIHHLTLEQAQRTLRAGDLPFRTHRMKSKSVPEGELIDVLPRPGTSLENVSEIVITVSSGRPIARP